METFVNRQEELEALDRALPRRREPLVYALCARNEVTRPPEGALVVTAGDIFGLD